MGSFRYKLYCRPYHVATIFAAFVMAAAALDYDDVATRFLDGDVLYQDDVALDNDPEAIDQKLKNIMNQAYFFGTSEENRARLLYKIMEAIRMRNEDPGQYDRYDSVDYSDVKDIPESMDVKDMVTKRLKNAQKQGDAKKVLKLPHVVRPQQKWKAKKKLRGLICYFKLCGFQPPI